jgi:hypothetical protein
LLYMIYLVCLVQQDQLDEQIKPDELDRPGLSQSCRPLSFHRGTIVFSAACLWRNSPLTYQSVTEIQDSIFAVPVCQPYICKDAW